MQRRRGPAAPRACERRPQTSARAGPSRRQAQVPAAPPHRFRPPPLPPSHPPHPARPARPTMLPRRPHCRACVWRARVARAAPCRPRSGGRARPREARAPRRAARPAPRSPCAAAAAARPPRRTR
eukprot:342264-Prymnesium_polylepis.1